MGSDRTTSQEVAIELTKYGHACVAVLNDSGGRIVIDPGAFSPDVDLTGTDAVLVTHEHPDHFVEATLRQAAETNPALEIWTNASVAGHLDGLVGRVHVVGEGDEFTVAGFEVRVLGQLHAVIHPDIPRIANTGFLLDGTLFHPGDALTIPHQPVETLMLPVHAPWSRISDLIDWVREVAPQHSIAVHDGALNEIGLRMVGGLLSASGPGIPGSYERLQPPETRTVA